MKTPALTAEHLREVLFYERGSGDFTWIKSGLPAGSIHQALGYVVIRIDGRQHYAHRLAFLHVTGAWPINQVDHIDGVRHRNSWANLRDVSSGINRQNQRTQRKSVSGLLGVSRNCNGWGARIKLNGVQRRLGTYATPEEAHARYLAEKRRIHIGCTI